MVYKFITRSRGVVIFSVSLIAFGAFSTFLMILSITLIPLIYDVPVFRSVMPADMLSSTVFWVSTVLNLLIFISWIICGIGALHLKEWARQFLRVVMSVYLINLFMNICLNIFLSEELTASVPVVYLILGIIIALSYYLAIIYFFSHPNIVRQFKYKSREY